MINPNWKRWIQASINKYFNDSKGNTTLLLEGEPKSKVQTLKQWTELAITGPDVEEQSKNNFKVTVTITAMCCTASGNDIYASDRLVGLFQSAFITCIPVYKFGNSPGDDNSAIIGFLSLKSKIDTLPWGVDSADIPITRTAVSGDYQMDL